MGELVNYGTGSPCDRDDVKRRARKGRRVVARTTSSEKAGRDKHQHCHRRLLVPVSAGHAEAADRVPFKIEFDQHHRLVADHPPVVTRIDRDYEALRIQMQALFADLGITTGTAAA